MPTLLVQLGDIHLKTRDDPVIERAKHIGATIAQEADHDTSTIVIVYSGDIVYSGLSSQFELAKTFISDIKKEILDRTNSRSEIVSVCVPGNHDCDFSENQSARDSLLQQRVDANVVSNTEKLDLLISPMQEYFKFASEAFDPKHSNSNEDLFYSSIDLADGKKVIRFHLLNTAWMSSIQEKPGSLFFPSSEMPHASHDYDHGIVVMHHPSNWFRQPDTMRQLKETLNANASIVLMGHEHVAEASKEVVLFGSDQQGLDKSETIYLNGGVIQESGDSSLCTFNTIVLNVEQNTANIKSFAYQSSNENGYFKCQKQVEQKVNGSNSNIGGTGAVLTDSMELFLDDPGAPLSHPGRDPRNPISLGELFVLPDLWEFSRKQSQNQQTQINAENIVSEILVNEKIIIEGLEKSGKTSLLKTLFREATLLGRLPLFVKASKLPKSSAGLRESVRSIVQGTYYKFDPDNYEQLSRDKKVIFIDDAHDIQVDELDIEAFHQYLETNFGTVVFSSEELVYQYDSSSDFLAGIKIAGYRQLRLLGLGEVLRTRFEKTGWDWQTK